MKIIHYNPYLIRIVLVCTIVGLSDNVRLKKRNLMNILATGKLTCPVDSVCEIIELAVSVETRCEENEHKISLLNSAYLLGDNEK